ncbi:MAG: Txe/YoeB family addiction module toxin [Lutibacter sp.]|jgi:toxin YoeB|nr:Txe/YoeB family addiction module toxin [Lutibacter sp.]MDP3946428.1 Txe/YoeB family addiction module toxin [Lutibacter sp.]
MEIIYSLKALEDINYWKKSGNKAVQKKIAALLADIIVHPYTGLGKPEALKYELSGSWSRRITKIDRLVYSVNIENNTIEIETLKGHY